MNFSGLMHPSLQYFFLTILVLSLFHAVFFIFLLKLFVFGAEWSISVMQISTSVNANRILYVKVSPYIIVIIFQTEKNIQENF